jgi:phospholipid/cholesterol/gamma-HCH transport system ATP-binding protein
MIEVHNIKKSFDGRVVIEDVSAIMKAGQCNLIIGSSGSGKTVLQKCIVGLFEPDSGDILYGGQQFTSMRVRSQGQAHTLVRMMLKGCDNRIVIQCKILIPSSNHRSHGRIAAAK